MSRKSSPGLSKNATLSLKKKLTLIFLDTTFLVKNANLHQYLCHSGELIRQPAAVSILLPTTFHRAHLNRYIPNFQWVYQKLTRCELFGLRFLQKREEGDFCHPKRIVFRGFFWTDFPKLIFLAKRSTFAENTTYILKALLCKDSFEISRTLFSGSYEAS